MDAPDARHVVPVELWSGTSSSHRQVPYRDLKGSLYSRRSCIHKRRSHLWLVAKSKPSRCSRSKLALLGGLLIPHFSQNYYFLFAVMHLHTILILNGQRYALFIIHQKIGQVISQWHESLNETKLFTLPLIYFKFSFPQFIYERLQCAFSHRLSDIRIISKRPVNIFQT